jgi:predicted nucleic acid-binding Zn ribbon protein
MPTYVYKFIDTGETIEVQQAFTDDALTEALHPDGRVLKVKKVFTPVGVTFKGGGFYKTDSRGGSKAGASKTESTSTTAADTAATGGSSTGSGGDSSNTSKSTESTSTSAAASTASSGSSAPSAPSSAS